MAAQMKKGADSGVYEAFGWMQKKKRTAVRRRWLTLIVWCTKARRAFAGLRCGYSSVLVT